MATLTLRNISKNYHDKNIIENFNLQVNDGEFIVIVGPSGCGKSTLLRMVAGLEPVSQGEIYIDEQLVNKLEPKDRNIAMVFQNYALYPHMTVYKNMAYGLLRRGMSKAEIREQVNKTAEVLGLSQLLDRKPRELSGGQRQRVAMGRAIVRNPKLFLFDEPLSNLDANLRAQMRLEIRKLQQQVKTTSLYVTHDQVEAMTLADRIILMNQGKIEQIDTPMNIYNRPQSVFVASFMGSPPMNFLSAQLNANADKVIIHGGTELPLKEPLPQPQAGQKIILGIRPESIIKASKQGADVFKLIVNYVESLGAEKLIYGHFPGDAQTLVLKLPSKVPAAIGEVLTLGVMPDSLHLYDEQTQRRMN